MVTSGSQIDPDVPISFVAADTDYSGRFIVSGWATTTVIDGADTYTATSASKTMTVNVQAVIDDVVFEALILLVLKMEVETTQELLSKMAKQSPRLFQIKLMVLFL